jgi:hypothetical protein
MFTERKTYRGWDVWIGTWPEPSYSATGPDYDVDFDENGWRATGGYVDAPTLPELEAEIDAYIEEHTDV